MAVRLEDLPPALRFFWDTDLTRVGTECPDPQNAIIPYIWDPPPIMM